MGRKSTKAPEVTLRETPASATYPAPGMVRYGKQNSDLKEIISILHNTGYVVDQNLVAHIANAIFRIVLRDGWCQFARFGRFIRHIDKQGNYYIIFHPNWIVRCMFDARLGLLEDVEEKLSIQERREREDIELLLAEIMRGQIDGQTLD